MLDGISIVMAYHNRVVQLTRTLNSIMESKFDKDKLEIIIVNDCSLESHNVNNIPTLYPDLKFNIINIKEKQKNWVNSCITYNIGFNHIKYNRVIIQNPESYHMGDILAHAYTNLTDYDYISYGCYSISYYEYIKNRYSTINYLNEPPKLICDDGWYNHSVYRPKYYHFCSAMSTTNLFRLNGFDEDYKDGIGWDDNEFIYRINKLGLNMKIVDNPFVLHQWHDSIFHYNADNTQEFIQNNNRLFNINQNLFNDKTIKLNTFKVDNNIFFKR